MASPIAAPYSNPAMIRQSYYVQQNMSKATLSHYLIEADIDGFSYFYKHRILYPDLSAPIKEITCSLRIPNKITGQPIRSKIESLQNANFLISPPNPMMLPLIEIVSERRFQ